MASQGDPTRTGGPPPAAPPPPADGGIDLSTLFLSAVASAAAAYITSQIWAAGTLFSAAMSPVIVALVKEGLRKPTEVVARAVPTVPTASRWSRTGASEPGLVVDPDPAAPPPGAPTATDPDAPHVLLPPVVAGDAAPVKVYSTRSRRLRWRLALITGLLGFAVCVIAFTVPELIAGKSIGGGGSGTTLFSHAKKRKATSTTTSTTPTTTSTTKTTSTTETTPTVTQTTTVTVPTTTTPTPAPAPSSATPSTATPDAARGGETASSTVP
jgi:hypothetical protein